MPLSTAPRARGPREMRTCSKIAGAAATTWGCFGEAVHERGPVLDAVVGDALQADVRRGAKQALLQVLAKAVGDGHGDDEGGDTGGDSCDGDAGDDADEGLAALGAQVAGRDEEFEAHEESYQLSALSFQPNSDYSESFENDRQDWVMSAVWARLRGLCADTP